MKLLTYTKNTVTLLLRLSECGFMIKGSCWTYDVNPSDSSELSDFHKVTGETASYLETLMEYIESSIEKQCMNNDSDEEIIELLLSKRDLWLIKHAVFFMQEDFGRKNFRTITGCKWEECKDFLVQVNFILKSCGCNEKAYYQVNYPIPLDEQAKLGDMYVYFLLARTQINLDILLLLLGESQIWGICYFSTYNKEEDYPDDMDYKTFLKKYQELKIGIFNVSTTLNGVGIRIYPDAIVFICYQKPWDTLIASESEQSKKFNIFEVLSKKAERIIMGFEDDDLGIAPTVDEFIERGQMLPTLERQSLNADFEIKNFNPNDEKHSNALKMLQFCAKDYLSFM